MAGNVRGVVIGLSLVVALGCGKKDAGGEKAKVDQAALDAAAAAANKAVPEGTKQTFKVYKGEKDRFMAVVPDGWKESDVIPGSFEPPKELGFMTSFRVGTNCDGTCTPKDWAAVAEKVNLKQFRGDKIEKEEDLGGKGKLLIADKGTSKHVVVVKWGEKSNYYITCSASLTKEALPLLAAAEVACRAVAAPF